MVVAEVAVTVEVAVGAVEGKVVVAVVVAVAVAPGRAARVTCDLPMRIVLNESMSSDHAVHDADVHWTVAARGVRELRQNCAALRELRQNCARIAPKLRSIARIALHLDGGGARRVVQQGELTEGDALRRRHHRALALDGDVALALQESRRSGVSGVGLRL